MHDTWPACGGEPEEDDVDDGLEGEWWGVEDVLVGADAGGGAEGSGGYARGFCGLGKGGVGFMVCPWEEGKGEDVSWRTGWGKGEGIEGIHPGSS